MHSNRERSGRRTYLGRAKAVALATGCAVCVGGASGCAQLLFGGLVAAQALFPVSAEQEVAIGRAAALNLLASGKIRLYRDPKVVEYVRGVGKKLAAISDRSGLPWSFNVIESKAKNAMALPGGYIFVTTGMLAALDNEAQLAGVLGHEISHVTLRHGVEQVKRAMVAQGLLISVLASSPDVAQVAGRIAADLVLRGYGREAELEADEAGAALMARGDYKPQEIVEMLAELRKGGDMPAWFVPLATHPQVEERIQNVRSKIQEQNLTGKVVAAERYRAAMAPLLSAR